MAPGEPERRAAVATRSPCHMAARDPVGAVDPEPVRAVELRNGVDEAHQDQGRACRGNCLHVVVGGLEIDEVAAEFFGQAVEEACPRRGAGAVG